MIILFFSLLALSCVKEEEEHVVVYSFPLTEKYYSSALFNGAVDSDDGIVFVFSDNTSVIIPPDGPKVFDCTIRDLPTLAVDPRTGEWTYNRILSGIEVDRSCPDSDSPIVCIAYNTTDLYFWLGNGRELRIPNTEEANLFHFTFLAADNKNLTSDLLPSRDGLRLMADLPQDCNSYKLIPDFSYRGKSLSVGGVEQTSRKTIQDFSEVIEYVLTLYDGTTLKYKVVLKGSGFPTVYIRTQNSRPIQDKVTWVPGDITILDEGLSLWDVRKFEAPMLIRGRGNATWNSFPKKPYRIKLNEKAPMFGLPKNKDWILVANYADKSLLRNTVAMKVSEILEFSWTPAIFDVEVYLNESYLGLYNFMDHKEVAKHRVDITPPGPNDNSGDAVTGDYYLEIEEAQDEKCCWWTDMGVPMMFKDPEEPTSAQRSYVKNYFKSFENALKSSYYADPASGYARYIDVDSWVNNYIIQELTKNVDGNLRKSTFITKEKGKKLEMYHVWDFDFTLGNCDYFDDYYGLTNTSEGWFIRYNGRGGYGTGWYYYLMKDPAFLAKVKARWNEVYPKLSEVPAYIDSCYERVKEAADRNFDRWPILYTYVWPNYVVLGTYAAEVDYLKRFYSSRLEWLNTEINKF
ncbi:MAG: CotH kinase family protein [Bacteroidales bacterium]|nr:CotH kinase family protein [Bacteroidales bacterium]